MQLLPWADHADVLSLALRPKCGREDYRDSPVITKEVESRVDMMTCFAGC